MRTSLLTAAVIAALITTGCVNTANQTQDSAQAATNDSPPASTVFAARLYPVEGLKTFDAPDNSVKVAFGGNTMFSHDGASLSTEAQQQLIKVANALNNVAFSRVVVLGYTDSSGKLAHNNMLSQQRADQVRSFLIKQGIATDRVSAEGRGPAEPIADNKTAQGRAANRRVELTVVFES
ncbi:OmpA family protein [Rheinheimera baltica]|uniref:OmpA family protein n=1 Tax=Rheinheimera baltica TaxID=67576 RepID=UPI0004089FD3|nr:OmpA family protein [Rheinheimera baltica]